MSKREILFRGKRIDSGEWVEGYLLQIFESSLIFNLSEEDGELFDNLYELESDTACQYTGLVDKNGRKIFEGDIIRYEKKRYSIVWIDGIASFASKPLEDMRYNPCINIGTMKVSEVIGNIFDNPELLN